MTTQVPTKITEADFQDTIVEYAMLKGWRIAHFRPARAQQGWRTAVSYQGAGYPDLTLARTGFVLFLEVKSEQGKLRPEQKEWLAELPNAHTVRPSDWAHIEELLA